jgi:hypothetical protein
MYTDKKAKIAQQHKQQQIIQKIQMHSGVNKAHKMDNGLKENVKRPVGGGKYGLLFGSSRPLPTG